MRTAPRSWLRKNSEPPAVVGQGRDRADDVVGAALVGAVVAFEAPQRDHHGRRHAGPLLDPRQQRGVGLQLLQSVLVAARRRHAAGELDEALLEHALPAVAPDDGRVEGHAVERRRDRLARDALRLGLLLEGGEPGLEAAGVAATRSGIGRSRPAPLPPASPRRLAPKVAATLPPPPVVRMHRQLCHPTCYRQVGGKNCLHSLPGDRLKHCRMCLRRPTPGGLIPRSPSLCVPHETDSQSHFPRGGPRHPLPARHQGHAQGDAAGGGPAADPARGGRGARGRHRAFHLRHRPQQGGDRGPFRPPVRAGADAEGAQQARRPEAAVRRSAGARHRELHPPAIAARPRPCGVVRARAGRPRAVRAAAARRAGAAQAGLPQADDRRL